MNPAFYWLTTKEVIAIHDDLVQEFGGSNGVLNEVALDSTLNRPKQLVYYEPDSDICALAATYGHGLVKSHAFVDGNKRTALAVMSVFLLRNGYELIASEVEAVDVIVNLAQDEVSQEELAVWLASNIEPVG